MRSELECLNIEPHKRNVKAISSWSKVQPSICMHPVMTSPYLNRAGVCLRSLPQFKQLSSDFTPESDRQRIQHIAFQRPELLRCPHTKEKLYNRHILSRKVRRNQERLLFRKEDRVILLSHISTHISGGRFGLECRLG